MFMIDEALTGRYHAHGNPEEAEAILAPAFGRSQEGLGVSNFAIARFAITQADQYHLPIYSQYGVTNAIRALGRGELVAMSVDPRTEQEEQYINSDQVLERVAGELSDRNVMVVAHAFHAPRFDAQAMEYGLTTILPKKLPRTWGWDNVWREAHCSSPFTWALREPLIIAHHKLTHRI